MWCDMVSHMYEYIVGYSVYDWAEYRTIIARNILLEYYAHEPVLLNWIMLNFSYSNIDIAFFAASTFMHLHYCIIC